MSLEVGKIYVFTASQGADADAYSTAGLTHGTHFVRLDIPMRISDQITTMKEPDDFPGGGSMSIASGYWNQGNQITGLLNGGSVSADMDRLGEWKEYLFSRKSDTAIYLIIKWGTGDYWPFIDTGDGTVEELCQGTFMGQDLSIRWFHHKKFFVEITFSWKNIH